MTDAKSIVKEISNASKSTHVAGLERLIIAALRKVKAHNSAREIWLVSGKVSPEIGSVIPTIERRKNETKLRSIRMRVQRRSNKRIYFTSADIMPQIRKTIAPSAPTYQQFLLMWRNVVSSGYLDGLYMAKNAHFSEGARDEHATATKKRTFH